MIPLIPILLFIAVQATFGVKYDKEHHGMLDDPGLKAMARRK